MADDISELKPLLETLVGLIEEDRERNRAWMARMEEDRERDREWKARMEEDRERDREWKARMEAKVDRNEAKMEAGFQRTADLIQGIAGRSMNSAAGWTVWASGSTP